jgi:glyoxalase family protein
MAVAPGTLGAVRDRLASRGVAATTTTAFGREGLMLVDPDGMALRIEEHARRQQPDAAAEVARVALHVPDARETSAFLESVFGFRETAREDRVLRLALLQGDGDGGSGREIDVVHAPELRPAQIAAGSVHHVAWRVPDDAAQDAARRALLTAGVAVTEVRDRQYFRSIYFRIPGGVLFEIATDGPGFAVDEPAGALGRALRLPPQYEPRRADIAARLPSLGDE